MNDEVWFKSSKSGSTGSCVEVSDQGDIVKVRDSKDPGGGSLVLTKRSFVEFVEAVKDGQFDPTA